MKFVLSLIIIFFLTAINTQKSYAENEIIKTNPPKKLLPEEIQGFEKNELYQILNKYITEQNTELAITTAEKMLELEPESEYILKILANLYFLNKEYYKAEIIIKTLYLKYPEDTEIALAYINSLVEEGKINEAFLIISESGLENTKQGYFILGEIANNRKNYPKGQFYLEQALKMDPEDELVKRHLAISLRGQKKFFEAKNLYNQILSKNPDCVDALIGLGYLEISQKKYQKAKEYFFSALKKNPDYIPAKKGIVNAYIANGENLKALDLLDALPDDDEVLMIKAQIYHKLAMPNQALNELSKINTKKEKDFKEPSDESSIPFDSLNSFPEIVELTARGLQNYEKRSGSNGGHYMQGSVRKNKEDLAYAIKKEKALTITPSYSFVFQELADFFTLDLHKFGIQMSQTGDKNINAHMTYNVIVYSSGGLDQQNNVTNEFRTGLHGRLNKNSEYKAEIGVKSFEFGNGAMLLTDSWVKKYFNDNFNMKFGFKRNNIEQSYGSAVGRELDGVFTGRAADNKIYFEAQHRLPNEFHLFAEGAYGVIYAQNLPTNIYYEGMLGFGKQVYNNPENKWIKTVGFDIISYNSSYQYNLLKITGQSGEVLGGYFSPGYFNATTLNIKMEGHSSNNHFKYGIKAFGGIQNSITPDQTTPAWGLSPYASYEINDNISVHIAYNHYTYADIQRDQFIINAVIKLFKKEKSGTEKG